MYFHPCVYTWCKIFPFVNCLRRKFLLEQVISMDIFQSPLLLIDHFLEAVAETWASNRCVRLIISYKHLCFNCFTVSCIHTLLAPFKIIIKVISEWAREMAQAFKSTSAVTEDYCSSSNIHVVAHNSSSKGICYLWH